MRIRCIPKLQFALDESIAYSIRIGQILNDLHVTPAEEDTAGQGEGS